MSQLKPKAHELLTWLNEQPFSMAIVTGLTNETKEYKPSKDYSEYKTEEQPCTKCEAGVVTVTVHTKPLSIHLYNGSTITAESFFNMEPYEQEAFVVLKECGNLIPLYRKDDTDNDGYWNTLMRYNIENEEYQAVKPDIKE